MKNRMMKGMYGVLAVTALAVSTASAAPLDGGRVDARWSALYGCWRPEAIEGVPTPNHMVCILPTATDGVSIATIANGKIVSEQTIIADGIRRATDEGGCKGFESASWSNDGRRVFLKSELNCGGDIQRKSTGILALVSPRAYVDVQSVDVGGEKASRTVRYITVYETEIPEIVKDRLQSEPLARESARVRAAGPLDFEDVVEATRAVGSDAINGVLVARRTGFLLNADRLRDLEAAGVEPATMDVMVALSYPKHFEVAAEAPRATRTANIRGSDAGRTASAYGSSCYDDYAFGRSPGNYAYQPVGSRYSRCGNTSFYSPYGYDPYGWGYGTGRQVIVVSGSTKVDEVNGVAVKGKGYTRRGEATGTARPKETPTTTTRASGTTSTSGSGAVKSGGSSGGTSSAGAAPARTAKPKGGGGLQR